jgi:hypothetical protein
MNLLVRNARLRGRDQLVDIRIEHGRITAIAPNLAALAAQMTARSQLHSSKAHRENVRRFSLDDPALVPKIRNRSLHNWSLS